MTELLTDRDLKTFSECVEISIPILYKYKQGVTLPTLQNAVKIADEFTCSLDFLFGLSDSTSSIQKTPPPFSVAFQNILHENQCSRYLLCLKTGISPQSTDDWYHGRRNPSIDNLLRMAKYFNCTLDHLVGRE